MSETKSDSDQQETTSQGFEPFIELIADLRAERDALIDINDGLESDLVDAKIAIGALILKLEEASK